MVADSVTNSELFHGSPPISRDFLKKRKANWLWKLKQWKINARRKEWKGANVGEDDNGLRVRSLRKTASKRYSWSYDDDVERASSASTSPTSVLKSKDSDSSNKNGNNDEEDSFDDAFDNFDSFRDALNSFENEESTNKWMLEKTELVQEEDAKPNATRPRNTNISQGSSTEKAKIQNNKNKNRRREKKPGNEQEREEAKTKCPVCYEAMDDTDLSFFPCENKNDQICAFCYKRIVEQEDGRCPICREPYDQSKTTNTGQVTTQQRGGGGPIPLSSSFKELDKA